MLYFDIQDKEHYENINVILKECLNFISSTDLTSLPMGQHKLTENISYNMFAHHTADEDDCTWEAHRNYIDVQMMIEGEEWIGYQHTKEMELGDYQATEDYLPLSGRKSFTLLLKGKYILILYPEDAHKTGITFEASKKVTKIVFKVRIV